MVFTYSPVNVQLLIYKNPDNLAWEILKILIMNSYLLPDTIIRQIQAKQIKKEHTGNKSQIIFAHVFLLNAQRKDSLEYDSDT